jgi:hypothetical protein
VKGSSPSFPIARNPLLTLAAGFTVSAVGAYSLVSAVGVGVLGNLSATAVTRLVGAAVLVAFLLVDAGVFGFSTPMCRRQTPRQLYARHGPTAAALMWGLDAGLVVTTFRVTSLSWAGLAVTLLGLVPWWSGLAYAAGFIVPMVIVVLAVPRAPEPTDRRLPDPIGLLERLHSVQPSLRAGALGALAVGSAACLAAALLDG